MKSNNLFEEKCISPLTEFISIKLYFRENTDTAFSRRSIQIFILLWLSGYIIFCLTLNEHLTIFTR